MREEIKAQSVGPINHAAEYDKYKPLITQQAEEDAAQFIMQGKHDFEDYTKELLKYKRLSGIYPFSTPLFLQGISLPYWSLNIIRSLGLVVLDQ